MINMYILWYQYDVKINFGGNHLQSCWKPTWFDGYHCIIKINITVALTDSLHSSCPYLNYIRLLNYNSIQNIHNDNEQLKKSFPLWIFWKGVWLVRSWSVVSGLYHAKDPTSKPQQSYFHSCHCEKIYHAEMYWCQQSVTTNADKVSMFIFHINNHAHSIFFKALNAQERHDKFSFHVRE